MKQRNPADYPSVDEVLQELEGNTTASATALEQDIYGQYAWEREVERFTARLWYFKSFALLVQQSKWARLESWECLVEAEGQLRLVGADDESPEERQGPPRDFHIKRALLRSLVILIDATDGMRETDFKPDRLTCATQLLEACLQIDMRCRHLFLLCLCASLLLHQEFLASFLLQNPLAQIALVFMADAAAEVLCPSSAGLASEAAGALRTPGSADHAYLDSKSFSFFSSNVDELMTALVARRRRRNLPTAHAPSLKNGLDTSVAYAHHALGGLTLLGFCRSIDDSIEELRKLRARCSVISLAPEVRIVRALATQTEGTFGVAMHRDHLCSLLMQHTQPPAWLEGLQPCLIRVGFPSFKESSTAALCSCHSLPRFRTYTCPLCSAKLCDLPCRCLCCSLHLLSPADVSRSFHSLCLPQPFESLKDPPRGSKCCCCQRPVSKASVCPECRNLFCKECDLFSHDQLRHCPFCVMNDIANIEEPADRPQTPNSGFEKSLRDSEHDGGSCEEQHTMTDRQTLVPDIRTRRSQQLTFIPFLCSATVFHPLSCVPGCPYPATLECDLAR
ncbi:hypothetical protein Esti_003070 [Eimeria stiedai]